MKHWQLTVACGEVACQSRKWIAHVGKLCPVVDSRASGSLRTACPEENRDAWPRAPLIPPARFLIPGLGDPRTHDRIVEQNLR